MTELSGLKTTNNNLHNENHKLLSEIDKLKQLNNE